MKTSSSANARLFGVLLSPIFEQNKVIPQYNALCYKSVLTLCHFNVELVIENCLVFDTLNKGEREYSYEHLESYRHYVLSKYKPDHLKKTECFSENKLASNTILTNAPWEYYVNFKALVQTCQKKSM